MAAGLCPHCGKRAPAPGQARCRECLDAASCHTSARKALYASQGRCIWCGKPKRGPARLCRECRERDTRKDAERRRNAR